MYPIITKDEAECLDCPEALSGPPFVGMWRLHQYAHTVVALYRRVAELEARLARTCAKCAHYSLLCGCGQGLRYWGGGDEYAINCETFQGAKDA